jgi:predicted kinase
VTGGASRGTLVVVCGLPGSGKTTTARRLVAERGGVRLDADAWMTALGGNLWDERLRERVEALQWSVGQDFLRLGVTVVVEWGTWSRAERDTLREGARELGASAELVHLDVDVEVLWRRIRIRGAEDPPVARPDLDGWALLFEAPDDAERRLYDRVAG